MIPAGGRCHKGEGLLGSRSRVPRSEETHARGQKVASKAAWWGISTRRLATSRRCPRTQKKHTPEAGQKSHLKGCLGGHLYAQARNLASVPVDPKRDTRQGRVPVIAKVIRSKGSLAKEQQVSPCESGSPGRRLVSEARGRFLSCLVSTNRRSQDRSRPSQPAGRLMRWPLGSPSTSRTYFVIETVLKIPRRVFESARSLSRVLFSVGMKGHTNGSVVKAGKALRLSRGVHDSNRR